MFETKAIVGFQIQILVQWSKEDVKRRLQLTQVQAGQARAQATLYLDIGRPAPSQALKLSYKFATPKPWDKKPTQKQKNLSFVLKTKETQRQFSSRDGTIVSLTHLQADKKKKLKPIWIWD